MRGRTDNDRCNYCRGGETQQFILEGYNGKMTLVCVTEALIVAIKLVLYVYPSVIHVISYTCHHTRINLPMGKYFKNLPKLVFKFMKIVQNYTLRCLETDQTLY